MSTFVVLHNAVVLIENWKHGQNTFSAKQPMTGEELETVADLTGH